VEDFSVRTHIYQLYKDRPEALNRLTATQWLVPESATILPNRVGSAPIMVFEKGIGVQELGSVADLHNKNPKFLIALPGVPHEMKIAMTEQVFPYLSIKLKNKRLKAGDIVHRTILLSGIPESKLAILIEEWENALPPSIHLAYLPKDGVIRLRLSSYGEATESEIDAQIKTLKPLIAEYLIATEDQPLEMILGNLLKEHKQTIATAESCTGGRLAAALNAQSGASDYYMGSVIDNNQIAAQIEYRQQIWKRLGAVVWGGYGTLFPDFNALKNYKDLHFFPNYGVGLRFEFKNKVNIRADYGFGKNTSGLIVTIGEAF
jgi:nicotinamide-nucleotide amidase